MEVFAARYVLPISAPPLTDGAVAVHEGRVVAVGPRSDVRTEVGPDASGFDLGAAVLLPGLVNAHTHLELSWLAGVNLPRGDFAAWLEALLRARDAGEPGDAPDAAQRAIEQLVERGTVAVGDVANGSWIAAQIARFPLHGVVFHEIYGLDPERAEEILRAAAARLEEMARDPELRSAKERVRVALTPHAPHTTSAPLLRALAGRAAASGDPLSVHVAESAGECALLGDGSGPLRALFESRGLRAPPWEPPRRSPVEHLKRLGVLTPQTLAVHCVHLEQPDHSTLQSTGAAVVTCPRSNARLGVGRAPIPALLREGIPVALGTDSLASAPDLDLFAEMAAVRSEHPGLTPATVLRMATLNGARALGLGARLGSIEPGKLAELIVVPLGADDDEPLERLCSEPERVYHLRDAAREIAETLP